MIKEYDEKHLNNKSQAILMVYRVSNRVLKKNLESTSEV